MMEMDLFTDAGLGGEEYDAFGAPPDVQIINNDDSYSTSDGERCGICMDIIIDRGVLDCCQHWFCFTCIDNWSTITNLCPLCQNEFQMITCVPVYDTIGSSQPEEDLYARDDDWCVEGNNSTLAFPSYYIDENAVICLEGDGCKVRTGSVTIEEGLNLDTSIACDSCDMWYHAFCVGFDPDGECEGSWLCPRCLIGNTLQTSSDFHPLRLHDERGPDHSNECLLNTPFPNEVSVSVADSGDTAVIVSMVEKFPKESLPNLNILQDMKTGDCKVETISQVLDGSHEIEKPGEHLLPSSDLCEDTEIDRQTHVSEAIISKQETPSSVATLNNYQGEDFAAGELHPENGLKECELTAEKSLAAEKEIIIGNTAVKRKQRDSRSSKDGDAKDEEQNNVPKKKAKVERNSRLVHSEDKADGSVSHEAQNIYSLQGGSDNGGNSGTDIKEIVQGMYQRPLKDRDNAAGLRVKKIMRRTIKDKDSSLVLEKLRKEIRDAIRSRSSKESDEKVFDPKLLAAFRAAVAGSTVETNRSPALDLKAKKALLQKGKVRENLTKKIYGLGGRRKRAWTRDVEVEFWKHRCLKFTKPEKVETLMSVLNLLRKSPESKEIKQENDAVASSSILSRLYLADASVFPRKDDVKPLSALKSSGVPEQSEEKHSMNGALEPSNSSVNLKEAKCTIPSRKDQAASTKIDTKKGPERLPKSTSCGSSVDSKKQVVGTPQSTKIDKRKWALEILARKTAVSGKDAGHGQEDDIKLKGNYPLVAQLPVDMRPVLAPSRHHKIPMSIRQVQLYRLTEHFLRKTNRPVSRPTAEIELAIADAINIEKEVADRSSSKLVYVNLCSQELSRKSDIISCKPSDYVTSDKCVEVSTNDLSSSSEVDEALRNAGLLSDSPPNSPYCQAGEASDELGLSGQEGPDNVFEIDSQPELDIYGDFEYNLEDEDFVGANALKISNRQPEESKIKVVFSTIDSDRQNEAWSLTDSKITDVVNMTENCISGNSLLDGVEEPVDGDCEDLYGPDKEPLVVKFPDLASIKSAELIPQNIVPDEKEGQGSNPAAKACEQKEEGCLENVVVTNSAQHTSGGQHTPNQPRETAITKEKSPVDSKKSDGHNSVFKKVEAYIKEHIRPLCKSGVINAEQYRWAVGKTTEKIMKYHSKDTNANFLIKEGEKVKKLAEQYVESSQKVGKQKDK